jgi:hypothetical protein
MNMSRKVRVLGAAILAALCVAGSAQAQTINFSIGMISDTNTGVRDTAVFFAAGADVPLSRMLSVRGELGSRWPGSRSQTIDLLRPGIGHTTIKDDSILDAAALLRFGTPADQTFQAGLLAGPHVELVKRTSRTIMPIVNSNPFRVEETMHEEHHWWTTLDIGFDAGVRLDERWTLSGYGIAALQPSGDSRRTEFRAGVITQYRF